MVKLQSSRKHAAKLGCLIGTREHIATAILQTGCFSRGAVGISDAECGFYKVFRRPGAEFEE
eukprot:10611459-Alexandrium_andersonii.AAC.1